MKKQPIVVDIIKPSAVVWEQHAAWLLRQLQIRIADTGKLQHTVVFRGKEAEYTFAVKMFRHKAADGTVTDRRTVLAEKRGKRVPTPSVRARRLRELPT